MSAWDRLLETGVARCSVCLLGDPERAGIFYAFDLRPVHGVLVVAFTPSTETAGLEGDESAMLERAPKVASVCKNERSELVKVDQALTQILGWSEAEMQGRRAMEFIHPDDHEIAIANWIEMLAAPGPGRRVRLRHRHRDGRWVWFEVTNHNLLNDPDHKCVVTGMVDITDEMAAYEALRAREQLLDRLAEAVPVGLVQIDATGHVVYTNDRLHQIVSLERRATVQQQLFPVVVDRSTLARAIEVVLSDGSSADIEVQLRLPSRELRRCAISLRSLSDQAGKVTGAIACLTDVTESARMREELTRRATFDELTGCYNRSSTMDALDEQLARNGCTTTSGVIFVDLNQFKQINDRFGHACGDQLLRIAAQRIARSIRAGDIVGRIGGDEFLVVLPNVDGPLQALEVAHRVAAALRRDVRVGTTSVSTGASIGVACSTEDGTDAEDLVAQADGAMYRSKHQGAQTPSLAT